jgi:hypothetical protein
LISHITLAGYIFAIYILSLTEIIVFPQSNANDMRVTQDLNSFGEIIAHAHCSVDEKMSDVFIVLAIVVETD